MWRRNFYDPAEREDYYSVEQGAADDSVHQMVASDPEQQHEERRIVERFASFPKGRTAVLSGGGGGSGSSTPKSRRRNKRKGCDSPRPAADDNAEKSDNVKSPAKDADDVTVMQEMEELPQPPTESLSQRRQQLSFDLFQLQSDDDSNHGGTYEPVTSHGMRPARGWASLDIISDYEDEAATLSPRVLSPEMDEPAGSYHVRRFGGGCIIKEPQERRTTFVALGSLMGDRSSSRTGGLVIEPDETPLTSTTARAKQLVQQIHSLKEKVKLYEDAFEQRYGYRPSHHQKMDDRTTKRLLTELARARKELKQIKERHHHPPSQNNTEPIAAAVFMMELAENSSRTIDPEGTVTTTTNYASSNFTSAEETVLQVQEHLACNRQLAGRPEVLEELTPKQVLDEKAAVQRALLYVESLHGRPTSYGHKDLLRPLYDRYRLLKVF